MREIVVQSLICDDQYTHKFIISEKNDSEVKEFNNYRKKYQTYI